MARERSMDTSALWKLTPVIALTTAALLLLTGVVMAIHIDNSYHEQKTSEVSVQAHILAATVTAALSFDDRKTAQEYVTALGVNPEIDAAAIYDSAGALFASFARRDDPGLLVTPRIQAPYFHRDRLVVVTPVIHGDSVLGSVYLRTQTEPWSKRFERYAGMALLVTMTSLVFAVLGVAHGAMTRANAALQAQAQALEKANRNLNAQIQEREKVEQALRQTQKMEAVGQLSGGIAHDFNNLLQALSGCLRMIERRAPLPEIRPLLDAGQQAVERGAKLTQQLLSFARRQTLRPEPVDVRDRLLGMSELLARALRADIKLDFEVEPALWPVEVDPTQFELAILNLATNARDAMNGPGRLSFSARNVTLSPGDDPEELTGDFVRVTVTDTGTGMSPEVLHRVFEPFFTTKAAGKGSGLGLSQVYGFTRQSNGATRIDSAVGRGTAITLLLPRCDRLPASSVRAVASRVAAGRGESVLLVEDDPIVAAMMAATVEDLGYGVTRAYSAADALARLNAGLSVDLLFTDVVMPGEMNGVDLAREARRLRPGLPVLLTTGYNEVANSEQDFPVLKKPYGAAALAEALSTAMMQERKVGGPMA